MRGLRAALAAVWVLCPGGAAVAQDVGSGGPEIAASAIVVLDRDALFANSLFGRKIARDIEAASVALSAENRQIEIDLEAEERDLTAVRDTMEANEFRELAEDFDRRVTEIRQTQDAKARAIAQRSDRAQQVFYDRANSILVALARETGALVVLDRRLVIASADQVDITREAQVRIDALLGDGSNLPRPMPERRPTVQDDGTPVDDTATPGDDG